jgi:DNA-binding transcriptional ArsR family regulator
VTDAVQRVLAALADDTRRGIVERLAGGATPTATELAAELPISRQAVTKHLRVLEDAALVAAHRQGREARYELVGAPLLETAAWMHQVGSEWDAQLERLKRAAEATRDT